MDEVSTIDRVFSGFHMTQGVNKLLGDQKAEWLGTEIALHTNDEGLPDPLQDYQFWTLTTWRDDEGKRGRLVCRPDGDQEPVFSKDYILSLGTLPEVEKVEIWVSNSVLMLPSDY